VAAVSNGAYGPRFVHLSKCNGDALSCLPALKAASSYRSRTGSCPVQVLSSLAQKSASSDIKMSAVNNTSTPGPQSFGSGTMSTSIPGQSASPTIKPKVRVRINKAPMESENPNGEQPQEPTPGNGDNGNETQSQGNVNPADNQSSLNAKITQLEKQVQSNTERWNQREKQYQIEKIIPKELFVDAKGRFNQRAWEAEIQNAMKETASLDLLAKYYRLQLMGKQMPEIEISGNSKSKRASSYYYYNPSPVPTSKGASSQDTDEDTERKMKLAELGKMVRGV
jgi:hypothetical protein